jgi:ribosome-binding factor A
MKFRKLRIQDQLREEISLIIQRDIKDPGIVFLTILEFKMTDDLKIAKVYCSVYGDDEEKKKTIEALQRSKGYIKFLLGKRVQLKYMPDLAFTLDNTFDKVARIEEILRKDAHVHED